MSPVKRKFMALTLVLGMGVTFQIASGCFQYYSEAALSAVDFCSVFNCDSSTFINLCSPVPILADCPTATAATP